MNNPADKRMRSVLIALACFAMLGTFVYQFWMARREAQSPAKIRQTIAVSGKAACIRSAGTTVTAQQANQYCECMVTHGLDNFTDEEIVAAAKRGANLNQSDRAKFLAPADICRLEAAVHKGTP